MPPNKPEQADNVPDSTLDKALNTKGFAEFLAFYPDAKTFSAEDQEELGKRFETFEAAEVVRKDVKSVLVENIKKEMGVSLDDKDMASVDLHINKQAVENPEYIKQLHATCEAFKKIPGDIKDLEARLTAIGKKGDLSASLDGLKRDRANLSSAIGDKGIIGSINLAAEKATLYVMTIPMLGHLMPKSLGMRVSDEYVKDLNSFSEDISSRYDALAEVKDKYGPIGKGRSKSLLFNVNSRIQGIEQSLADIKTVEETRSFLEKSMADLKKNILSDIGGIAELKDLIQTRIATELQSALKTGDIKALDKARDRFSDLKDVEGYTTTDIDPFGKIDDEKYRAELDKALEKAISERMMETIMNMKLGTNALDRLERSLGSILERDTIGSKEDVEARDFLINSLEECRNGLGDSMEGRAKGIIVSGIITKIRMKK